MDVTITPDPEPRNTRWHKKIVSVERIPGTKNGHYVKLECSHRIMTFGDIEKANGVVLCDQCRFPVIPDRVEQYGALLKGITFYDQATNREMKYVYPDTPHWAAGWILYRHVAGHWVTLRKATDDDIARINKAVVEGHHAQ